jgi:uncharacterized protein YggE
MPHARQYRVALKPFSLLILGAFLVAACGVTPVQELADRTCAQLDDSDPAQMPGVFEGAVLQARGLGVQPQDLMAELFQACAGAMSALTSIASVESGTVTVESGAVSAPPPAPAIETAPASQSAPSVGAVAEPLPAARVETGGLEAARASEPDRSSAQGVTATGTGTASAPPDIADITLGVEIIDADASAAINENNVRMAAVRAALSDVGIADLDVQTVSFNMWVEQVFGPQGPTGEVRYHVVNQVRVRLRDLTQTGELLEQALAAGANSVSGITFGVEDVAALRRKARDLAVDDAQARAAQLASRLGVELGSVREVTEGGSVVPAPGVQAERLLAGGGGGPPISGGEFAVSVSVQVVFDIAR